MTSYGNRNRGAILTFLYTCTARVKCNKLTDTRQEGNLPTLYSTRQTLFLMCLRDKARTSDLFPTSVAGMDTPIAASFRHVCSEVLCPIVVADVRSLLCRVVLTLNFQATVRAILGLYRNLTSDTDGA